MANFKRPQQESEDELNKELNEMKISKEDDGILSPPFSPPPTSPYLTAVIVLIPQAHGISPLSIPHVTKMLTQPKLLS